MIIRRETPLALYKGLGAVLSGIVPKMAIRFASFEAYKSWLADRNTGKTSVGGIFIGTYYTFIGRDVQYILPCLQMISGSWRGDHRSGGSSQPNGSREDQTTSTAAFTC
jgi:hypothetical protein